MKQASMILALCMAVAACSSGGSDNNSGGEAPGFKLDNPASSLVPTPPASNQLPNELLPPA